MKIYNLLPLHCSALFASQGRRQHEGRTPSMNPHHLEFHSWAQVVCNPICNTNWIIANYFPIIHWVVSKIQQIWRLLQSLNIITAKKTYLVNIPPFRIKKCKRMTPWHKALLDITKPQAIKREHVFLFTFLKWQFGLKFEIRAKQNELKKINCSINTNLFILKPWNTFWSEDKPIIPAATFHYSKIVDAHVPLSNNLVAKLASCLCRVFRLVLCTAKHKQCLYNNLILPTVFEVKNSCLSSVGK